MDAALIVLDGWGLGDHDRLDAVRAAETPTVDDLSRRGAVGTLRAWGQSVGLPKGGMGNSEVGHLTIGAGRIVEQAHTRLNRAIEDGSFAENEAIRTAFEHAAATDGHLHFLGLLSDAGVHADHAHLHVLIGLAAEAGLPAFTHAFTDGRDTPPTAGRGFVAELEAVAAEAGTGRPASVIGRYYAMDRDEHWSRTHAAYEAIVDRDAEHRAASGVEAVDAAYDRGETDEFIAPTIIDGAPAVSGEDAIVAMNFRADRMRQLVRMLADIRPEWPFETNPPPALVVTMTDYDETFDLPVAFERETPTDTLGEVVAAAGLTQLRIAETEKYAHVTYFLNGGREVEFDGERRRIVPSPAVPTYDLHPEMSAAAVTDAALEVIAADDPDLLVVNYANPDMVGHTGDFEATVIAVETVDAQLGRLVAACLDRGAHVFVTADHGNADDMGTPDDPHTAHTFNPVPFIYLHPDGTDGGMQVRPGGGLDDIAPTILDRIGIGRPSAMTGRSLLEAAAGREG